MQRAVVIACTGAILSASVPGDAHWGDLVFPIYEIPTADLPDLHDGTLEDWEDIVPGASVTDADFASSVDLDDVIYRSSLAFRVFLAWHDDSQRIYIAIDRFDDVHFNRHGRGDEDKFQWLHNNADAFEILLDGDHGGETFFPSGIFFPSTLYQDESLEVMNVRAQRWVTVAEPVAPEVQGNNRIGLLFHPGGWFALPPYADFGGHVSDFDPPQSITEGYVTAWDLLRVQGPEQSVPSVLWADKIIGIDLFVWDWDGPTEFELDAYVLYGTANPISASGFKDAQLLPCFRAGCSHGKRTMVETDSWARIKASFLQ